MVRVRRRSSVQVAVVAADNVAEFRHQHRDVGDDGLGRSVGCCPLVGRGRAGGDVGDVERARVAR